MTIKDRKKGIVFNIQRYSIDDGPGIRTTVFLKGCPLRCLWCCNPESQSFLPELAHREKLCIKCERCVKVCPNNALRVDAKGWYINRELCNLCRRCVNECLRGALKILGERLTPEQVMKEILKDIEYYKISGGGVTLSGGEPLAQPRFASAIFRLCRDIGINTCLDTSGYGSKEALERVLPFTDLVYFDLKHPDPKRHKELTGKDNRIILRNLEEIKKRDVSVVIRFPLIPGLNDDKEALRGVGNIMRNLGLDCLHILPYHRLGVNKYKMLGRAYTLESTQVPSREKIEEVKGLFENMGLKVTVRI